MDKQTENGDWRTAMQNTNSASVADLSLMLSTAAAQSPRYWLYTIHYTAHVESSAQTGEWPGERDNARNNARCTQARKTTHARRGWTTSRRGQDSPWKSRSEWQRTEINGESMSMVWPTLWSRTDDEQNGNRGLRKYETNPSDPTSHALHMCMPTELRKLPAYKHETIMSLCNISSTRWAMKSTCTIYLNIGGKGRKPLHAGKIIYAW